MRLGEIHPASGATRPKKRRGKGAGTGLGGTAGKGHKGHKARAGGKIPASFEGGQMPIQRRLPKRGFHNFHRVEYQVVQLGRLAQASAGAVVDLPWLKKARLVRGTTAGPLVKLLREAGATEVHVRITCPPITHACHFGVDMGHDGDLMAARLTVEEIRQHIGADSLAFLSLEGMMRAITIDPGDEVRGDVDGYCNACFTGRYPMEVAEAQAKLAFEGVLA